jgi:isocitrate lyase
MEGIERPYTAEEGVKLQGSLPNRTQRCKTRELLLYGTNLIFTGFCGKD